MGLLDDLFNAQRDPASPPAWDERARRPGAYGSTGWLTPSKAGLLNAAIALNAASQPRAENYSTTDTLSNIASALSQGALAGSAYQEEIERNRNRAAYLASQTQTQQMTSDKNRLWASIPDNDPIFAGLSPERIRTLKSMTYEAGSKALGEYRMSQQSRVLTDEEERALGLPGDAAYRINERGKVERIGAPGSTTTVNIGDDFNKGMSELAVDRIAEYQGRASGAAQDVYDRVKSMQGMVLSGQVKTGAIENVMLPIQSFAASAGFDVGDLGPAQLYKASEDFLAPRMRVPGSGSTSDFEVQMYRNAVPKYANTPVGNLLLAGTIVQTIERDRRLAEAAENYAYGPGEGTLKGWNKFADENNLWEIYPRPQTREEAAALNPGTVFIWDGELQVRGQ